MTNMDVLMSSSLMDRGGLEENSVCVCDRPEFIITRVGRPPRVADDLHPANTRCMEGTALRYLTK